MLINPNELPPTETSTTFDGDPTRRLGFSKVDTDTDSASVLPYSANQKVFLHCGLMSDNNEALKVHPDFTDETADLSIRSSDNVIFKVHQRNIDTHTTVFPPFPCSTDDNVELSERSEVLEVLFKYTYPTPPLPDLGRVAFPLLEEISIAADKYQFTSLSVLCDVHMGLMATTNTTCVLRYALLRRSMGIAKLCDKHIESIAKTDPAQALRYAILERQDEDMADRIGVYTLGIPVGTAATMFTGDLFRRWILFREYWTWALRRELPPTGESYEELQRRAISRSADIIPAIIGAGGSYLFTFRPKFSDTKELESWREAEMGGKLIVRM